VLDGAGIVLGKSLRKTKQKFVNRCFMILVTLFSTRHESSGPPDAPGDVASVRASVVPHKSLGKRKKAL